MSTNVVQGHGPNLFKDPSAVVVLPRRVVALPHGAPGAQRPKAGFRAIAVVAAAEATTGLCGHGLATQTGDCATGSLRVEYRQSLLWPRSVASDVGLAQHGEPPGSWVAQAELRGLKLRGEQV